MAAVAPGAGAAHQLGWVLMPFAPSEVGGLPPAWASLSWDGRGEPPDAASLRRVEFFVIPYGFHAAAGALLPRLPRLRVVQSLSAGVDDLLPHLPDGTTLCNARGVHDASTAELALALILAALRGIPDFVHDQLPEAEVVVLTLPLTTDTRGMVDAAFLAPMRDSALLVNVARGPIVDTQALLGELRSGRLSAALDVTDPEPLPAGHALWSAPNTLISPHAGGSSWAFLPRARALVQRQLASYVTGRALVNVVRSARTMSGPLRDRRSADSR